MSETFGHRLRQFAWAVDIVDEDTFKQVWELVRGYVSRKLELTYWALLVESEVNHNPGLHARECSTGNNPSFSLKTAEGSYNGLAAYAFAEAKNLWIVSPDEQPLGLDTHLRDRWSDTESLPSYHQSNDVSIKTVILIPFRWRGRTLGVLDLQMSQYYEPTEIAKGELELLVDALSVLLVVSNTTKTLREHTHDAIKVLRDLEKESGPPWAKQPKPQIFVASSHRADGTVMGEILDVLNDFKDSLRIYDWRKSPDSGNINWETLKQVKESRFGLCYFSEPVEDGNGGLRYQDNANVIFEAGMFQSLTNPAATDHPIGWIPVRESPPLSPPPPFDFAQQRMIIVQRLADNKPNVDRLRADLRERIEGLLKTV
jgi:hypothetical protein